eukprot:XP_002511366.2 RING-H2 finger protein ATL43 [Ricinus communis]
MYLFMRNNKAFFSFFFFILLFSFSLFQPLFADVDSRITPPPDAAATQQQMIRTTSLSNHLAAPPPLLLPNYMNSSAPPFKPSIAVIVGVLTTMFSITLLLLLYAKHCKRAHIYNSFNNGGGGTGGQTAEARKNSGIDRAVIESLPIFRFSSLRGQKDGLECAVCLTRFEPPEVLRLLPKCKHAFHVECVDTWLDAHSTCPLCRYRVDPEDVLLIDQDKDPATTTNISLPPPQQQSTEIHGGGRRISGRHSSAGEKASGFALSQIVVQRPSATEQTTWFARRSLDSFSMKKNKNNHITRNESVAVGCFDRYQSHQRKDGLLLLTNNSNGDGDSDGDDHSLESRRTSTASVNAGAGAGVDKTRFEHRIIVSGNASDERWSDVHPSDLLYLRSEMILSDNRRFSMTSGSRPSVGRRQHHQKQQNAVVKGPSSDGRSVINGRSVSEITGLNRFSDRESNNSRHHRERQAGVVSRWLAWISSQSHPAVRSFRTTTTPSDAAV